MKRWTPRARGQMFPLISRFAHLSVVLAEREAKRGRREGAAQAKGRRARVAASRKAQDEQKQQASEQSTPAAGGQENP